MLYVDMQFVVV